ncbi:cysteine synthase A [Candidatus Woesearchaeota archaeon]|nr:MAG: cysteine synthase A [Candidatus Woesearchaeota archaeon]
MNQNILKLIGNTPLVRINRLNQNLKVDVYAKLEYLNPGGSVKDRIALSMIEAAERTGKLKKKTILEATSGNTGIGLAMVAAVKGYKALFTMSEAVSQERRDVLKAFGANTLLTPKDKGTDGAIEKAYQLAREKPDEYYLVDQYNNPYNWKAHYRTTGEEIWKQTNGKITMFVAGIGTTGTLIGTGKKLKEYNPEIKVIGVEPFLGHNIQGLKNLKEAYKPGIWDKTIPDEIINIRDEDAYEMARKLAKEEGLLVGISSGAAMHIALQKAKELREGLIVVILPDSGERYLSTELFRA